MQIILFNKQILNYNDNDSSLFYNNIKIIKFVGFLL